MKMNLKNKDTLKEIAVYVFFGVLTTVVSMTTYFAVLWIGENAFSLSPESAGFNVVRVIAEILQWVFAVLFAFFTNKKWVFKNADDSLSTASQLIRFSASRLATLGLDAAITFGTVWILQAMAYEAVKIWFVNVTADLISKILASVVVVISNYVLSKIFVFKDKKKAPEDSR